MNNFYLASFFFGGLMIYLYSFLFCGTVCLLGELVLDNTKLTPGHITSLFVSLGALLSYFNIYPWFGENIGIASSIHLTSFGNLLYHSCLEGFHTKGVLEMFSNLLTTTSAGISASVIFAFLVTVFLSPKD